MAKPKIDPATAPVLPPEENLDPAPAASADEADAPDAAKDETPPSPPSEEPKAAAPSNGLVRVMVLAHVGPHKPGQIVEVTAEQAKYMCEPRKKNDGHGVVSYQVAMKHSEWEALQKAPKSKTGLTQGEMTELGMKNVVETPKDPAFEAHLARLAKANQVKDEETKKNQKSARAKIDQRRAALDGPSASASASE